MNVSELTALITRYMSSKPHVIITSSNFLEECRITHFIHPTDVSA